MRQPLATARDLSLALLLFAVLSVGISFVTYRYRQDHGAGSFSSPSATFLTPKNVFFESVVIGDNDQQTTSTLVYYSNAAENILLLLIPLGIGSLLLAMRRR